MLLQKSGFGVLKQACSRTIQTPALIFVRGAHHRRCAREGLTAGHDALDAKCLQVQKVLLDARFLKEMLYFPSAL